MLAVQDIGQSLTTLAFKLLHLYQWFSWDGGLPGKALASDVLGRVTREQCWLRFVLQS